MLNIFVATYVDEIEQSGQMLKICRSISMYHLGTFDGKILLYQPINGEITIAQDFDDTSTTPGDRMFKLTAQISNVDLPNFKIVSIKFYNSKITKNPSKSYIDQPVTRQMTQNK